MQIVDLILEWFLPSIVRLHNHIPAMLDNGAVIQQIFDMVNSSCTQVYYGIGFWCKEMSVPYLFVVR